MTGPTRIETARLVLRKPKPADAAAILARYSGDPEVTRYMSWPCHRSVEDTRMFLAFSDAEWERWPAGPYLIEYKESSQLLGSTGFGFESQSVAATGYILAKDSWGLGYATEALRAIVDIGRAIGLRRLHAAVHSDHAASAHVLEKCGFKSEGVVMAEFPNVSPSRSASVQYALILTPL